MIGYIVPVKAAEASYDFIREYEITFIIIFSMLVTVVIFYIIYKNRQEKSRLLKRAQRDALTGLLNKKDNPGYDRPLPGRKWKRQMQCSYDHGCGLF
ncbi:MAG: hypothetical protein V8R61_10505 [Enterocloster sp.]